MARFVTGLALGLIVSGAAAQVSNLGGYATKSDIPTAATAAPPDVSVNGATGTDHTQFALANHTHATSVQRAHMPVTGQPITWVFAKPYDVGVEPVVVCTARNVAGATRPYVVNVVGTPTNVSAQVVVFQSTQPTVSLLGASLTLFTPTTSGTVVDCQAAKATQ